ARQEGRQPRGRRGDTGVRVDIVIASIVARMKARSAVIRERPLPHSAHAPCGLHSLPMTLYFAYGSNMSRAPMRARCPSAREVGTATLAGYRLIVTSDAYASAVPEPGGTVHGLVWRLAPRDLAALNAYENLATGLFRVRPPPGRLGARQGSAL